MNIKEKPIQTKEEILMYAAAMLYAKMMSSHMIFDCRKNCKTEIADITDMAVIKK